MISRIIFVVSIISLIFFSLLSVAAFGSIHFDEKISVLGFSVLVFAFVKAFTFIFFGKEKNNLADKHYLDYADKIFYLTILIGIITTLI